LKLLNEEGDASFGWLVANESSTTDQVFLFYY
jgi:hypothetical protein